MNAELERVADVVFSAESTVSNVKFFRGLSRDVTAEQLSSQLELATQQIADRRAELVTNIDGDATA